MLNKIIEYLTLRETKEMIHTLMELFNQRINKNPYEIDKEWAKYLYISTKMTFAKWLTVLFCILPTFSTSLDLYSMTFTITGCFTTTQNETENFLLSDCIMMNNQSISVEIKYSEWDRGKIILYIIVQIFVLLPHIVFFIFLYFHFRRYRIRVWLKAARIEPKKSSKRWMKFEFWFLLGYAVIVIFLSGYTLWIATNGSIFYAEGYSIPYNGQNITYNFVPNKQDLIISLVKSIFIYICIITTMKRYIDEPLLFFTGFRKYQKSAARLTYNPETIMQRIGTGNKNMQIIKIFYDMCDKYEPDIVLNAFIYFVDKSDSLILNGRKNSQFISLSFELIQRKNSNEAEL